MSTTKTLLILFVFLTIVLAAVSVFEYSRPSSPGTTTLITTYTITNTASLAIQPLSSTGFIQINNGSSFKTFYYVQWNSSIPSTFTINQVKFVFWTNATVIFSGGSCYGPSSGYEGYVITFPDGTSEGMTTCIAGLYPPTTIRLTTHMNPQAGLFIFPQTGATYFLVST